MYKRIVIVGKAGSGKDYIRDGFHAIGFMVDVSVTTRPMREGETRGYTYDYITKSRYDELVDKDALYEHVTFNGWHYGTTRESWQASQVFIMTPSGTQHITKEDREECYIVYLNIDEATRRHRIAARSDADKVERRLAADFIDFAGYRDYDTEVTNARFDRQKLITVLCAGLIK